MFYIYIKGVTKSIKVLYTQTKRRPQQLLTTAEAFANLINNKQQ